MNHRQLLLDSFRAAVAAADALQILPPHLPAPPAHGRTLVVGAGKAAAAMALAVERHWPAGAALEGLVVTRYGHGLLTGRIKVVEAGHPVPDEAGAAAAREMLRQVRALGKDDLLLVLVSGGGSALLSLPAEGVSLPDLRALTRQLLASGAAIQDMNTVRKHLSAVHGGQLAAACRGRVAALIISDVTGDDPAMIASGPCAPDPGTFREALEVLQRFGVQPPPSVAEHLQKGLRGEIAETPKPGDPLFRRVSNTVIANGPMALRAGAACLAAAGVPTVVLGEDVTGEAAEVARVYAAIARQVAHGGGPWPRPVALLSGGECTVTLRDTGQGAAPGRGGRCSEFLLALGTELAAAPQRAPGAPDTAAGPLNALNVWALACDTDGIDGSEDNAGAILTPDTLRRAQAAGLDARALLARHDSWGLFSALGDLVTTGPTRTNVNDYRVVLVP